MAQSEAPHVRGFLFADLRGYTQFVEKHGDKAASELLSAYRTLVRAAVAQSNGAEIRTEGDGFYVVFPSPSSAIRCGLAILEEAAGSTAAAGGALPVGIGVHAGETEDSAEGFVGSAVNIAARVCALAAPGELLVTETVRGLVRTSMPLTMEPRGRRHLKGIREPIALFAMRPEGAAPRSRSQRLRSVSRRTLDRRPVLAAFAALAGVAAVAAFALALGLLANTTANPSAAAASHAASARIRTATSTPSPSPDDTFPNAAERALLARIDPAMTSFCRRAAASDVPVMQSGLQVKASGAKPTVAKVPVRAGVRCAPGGSAPDVVFVWAVTPTFEEPNSPDSAQATAPTFFFRRAGSAGASRGDCAADDLAYMDWSFGPLAGRLLCVATPARARFDWIFDGEDLIATAERDDGDGAALYRWWLDEGRSILH
jgi:class 3 adenylate cyclase